MKLRSREINIFSMSALDLFALAMGTFMFLAIMSLPFFPNTGNSKESIAKIKSQLELQKKKSGDLEKALAEEKSTARISFPSMDIVIALDTTASMGQQIEGLQREIVQLAELIMKLSPDAAMGVIDFQDRCVQVPVRSFEIVKLNDSSLMGLQGFADSMHPVNAPCNRDYEEAIDAALVTAQHMKWRSSSRAKVIILISDSAAYQDKSAEMKSNVSNFRHQCEKCQVSAVFVPTKDATGKAFLEEIAKLGGGKFVTGGGSFAATILLALAE